MSVEDDSDELVRRAAAGEGAAFTTLVERWKERAIRTAYHLTGSWSDADDVAQEAFLRAYQNLHKYDDARPFDLWVMAIVRNLCLDLLRRRSKVRTEELEPMKEVLGSNEPSVEQAAIDQQERRSLESAMATLSADDREVLALYYVQKRTTKEIAVVMGVAPGTIMARLFRAREKLRKKMTSEELS